MRALALLPFLIIAPACDSGGGGDDPFTGTFEVTSHTLVSGDCGATAEPVDPANSCFSCMLDTPFFKVKRQSFFGQSIHTTVGCDTATTCADDGDDPNTINIGGGPLFDRAADGGLVGDASAAATAGAGCSYTGVRYVLTPTMDGVTLVRTETRLKSDAPSAALDGDDCLDLTDSPPPADELECREIETLAGRNTAL